MQHIYNHVDQTFCSNQLIKKYEFNIKMRSLIPFACKRSWYPIQSLQFIAATLSNITITKENFLHKPRQDQAFWHWLKCTFKAVYELKILGSLETLLNEPVNRFFQNTETILSTITHNNCIKHIIESNLVINICTQSIKFIQPHHDKVKRKLHNYTQIYKLKTSKDQHDALKFKTTTWKKKLHLWQVQF